MRVSRWLAVSMVLVGLVGAAAGCDKKASSPAPQTAANVPPTLTQGDMRGPPNGAMALPGSDASVDTNALHVSDAIARACGLPKQETHASFDFDSSSIVDEDKVVLEAVAKCLTEGPLRGRRLSLVGRADARGEGEYNMGLGGSRSESVRQYLKDLGVERDHMNATSRGEIDATGTDEAGWARDRRVDLELAD